MELGHHLDHGDEEEGGGHQVGDENGGADEGGAAEFEAGERIAGGDAHDEGNDGGESGNHHGVGCPGDEFGFLEEVAEVFERGVGDVEGGFAAVVKLAVRLQGRDEHPVEGADEEKEGEAHRDVEEQPALGARIGGADFARLQRSEPAFRGAQITVLRRMRRSCQMMRMSSTGSMVSEMAAPSPMFPEARPCW